MNLLVALQIGLLEIWAHKFRSILSMLGIVLGVSSLIATLALTTGIERGVRVYMEQMGGLEYVRVVDKVVSNKMFEFWNLSPGLTLRDVRALRENAPLVANISGELHFPAVVSSGGGVSERQQILGVLPDHFVVARHELLAGRFLTALDVERGARCAVIGHAIATLLWPDDPAEETVGRQILINNNPFEIVGVLPLYEREREKKRRELLANRKFSAQQKARRDSFRVKNEAIMIPFPTAFFEFRSGDFPDDSMESVRLDNLILRIGDLDFFSAALDQVRATLGRTHRGVDDFDLETREEWFDRMEESVRATKLSGGFISLISLLVGGIGIMNIMLASISERVREIGIRLAVGATGRDIFIQILVESITISFLGGLLGVVAAFGMVEVFKYLAPSENDPIMTLGTVAFSVGFAILTGFLAGIYPALQASRLNPIAALRYE